MVSNHNVMSDDRDELGSLSPDNKRRKYNGDHGGSVNRTMPPRYSVGQTGVAVGPGTPFPFGQHPSAPHSYPPAAVHARRESLPGLRGVVSPPGPMAPPPRPGMGYQQHRLSQGHITHDRSLTLPPLQTANQGVQGAAAGSGKTAEEQIMNIGFRYKIKVLNQVAPPAVKGKAMPRGPLIAIEGDNAEAAKELAKWMKDLLSSGTDLDGNLLAAPDISTTGSKEEVMAQYHRLAADWLGKSKVILESLTWKVDDKEPVDATMTDVAPDKSTQSNRKIDEDYDDSSFKDDDVNDNEAQKGERSERSSFDSTESMDVDKNKKQSSTTFENNPSSSYAAKPVSIIPNYSLHTSNMIACSIPLGSSDPYSPNDHWQWTATQWRGIIGPDLTIYIRDTVAGESGRPSVEIESVDGRPDVGLFVVRRMKQESQETTGDTKAGNMQVEASVLRRVGFEVSEWVRAFGTAAG